ncbi:hypothetical protein ACWEQH_32770, partial [Streptomyces sp. NPDC004166]
MTEALAPPPGLIHGPDAGAVALAGTAPDRLRADLPSILDYDIIKSDRTYQYFEGKPLYPFGYG